jgi:hypothetical protein
MCDQCEKNLKQVAELATRIEASYRATLASLTRQIPRYLRNMGASQQNGTVVTVPFQSQVLTRVTTIAVVVTSNATLQIGNFMTIPIPIGYSPIFFSDEGGLVVDPTQVITLTQATSGYMGVWCFGQLLPDQGPHY